MKKISIEIIYDFEDENQKEFINQNISEFDNIVKKIAKSIFDIYKIKKSFSLYFVKVSTIQELNKKYRNIDKATDVLTFASTQTEDYLGEIIISFENIIKRAEIEEESIENTLIYMIFHSFLHLLGYNHDNEEEYKIIEEKTEELLRRYENL
ncbi:MAG TPA: rRNA maturation RNase YbeY [Exilispira sp.]|mgnify:CR=1 FL=1|nr:rRNA maturation RNase YbeY [Exilispira sp.]